jgi:hypothetical protein
VDSRRYLGVLKWLLSILLMWIYAKGADYVSSYALRMCWKYLTRLIQKDIFRYIRQDPTIVFIAPNAA